jgi:hypothetical protein
LRLVPFRILEVQMASDIGEQWTSALTVAELAAWFKAAVEVRNSGIGWSAKLVSKGGKPEFFTPKQGDDPFARFGPRPAFTVGVTMPRGGKFSGSGERVTIHMYVTDAGERRHVDFYCPVAGVMDQWREGSMTNLVGHSKKASKVILRYFTDELQMQDDTAAPATE